MEKGEASERRIVRRALVISSSRIAASGTCRYGFYSHAVELFLKAFLRLNGLTVDELSKKNPYGHDLLKLFEACVQRGLALPASDQGSLRQLIGLLMDGHDDYQYRYFDKSFTSAGLNWIRGDVRKLAEVVRQHVEAERRAWEEEAKAKGRVLIDVAGKLFVDLDRKP